MSLSPPGPEHVQHPHVQHPHVEHPNAPEALRSGADRRLAALLADTVAKRDALADALRRGGPSRRLVPDARSSFVAALECYVSALAARGLPVPRRLRDDLRLQQALSQR